MSEAMRLCAVSVDLDEVPCYAAIHGIDANTPALNESAHAIYEKAVPRLQRFFERDKIAATFFAVGQDLAHAPNAEVLRDLQGSGHEIASHSFGHHYDLTRRGRAFIEDDIRQSLDAIERATGKRPTGFRAPGYTITNEVFEVLRSLGLAYDSSVFPCPSYYSAKAAMIGAIRARALTGKTKKSHSIIDDPRVLTAPANPYAPSDSYWRASSSPSRDALIEVPIGVTRRARLPFIGTSVALAGEAGAQLLALQMVGRPVVVLELHGIDLADADEDGLQWLRPHQPDLRKTAAEKDTALRGAISVLRANGYKFVTTHEAAMACKSAS
jgi:hypothetical protein